MLNQSGERTLTCSIIPKDVAHVNGIISIAFKNIIDLVTLAGCEASIPFDFLVKTMGKNNLFVSTIDVFPLLKPCFLSEILCRTLLLNCLNKYYEELWNLLFSKEFTSCSWTTTNTRLKSSRFTSLSNHWCWNVPLRTDYERRQALVELDVLVAMALGMTFDQLKTIYQIQFPVLQQYEENTWYDSNGRIVFTNNRSLTDVGFSRNEWENILKKSVPGEKFCRTIIDDTMPGGPRERTIEYVAPFDRCNREKDYEIAWCFFKEKYK